MYAQTHWYLYFQRGRRQLAWWTDWAATLHGYQCFPQVAPCSLLLAACSLLHAPCSLVPAPCTCWPPSSRCSTGSCGRLGAGVIRWKFDWKFIQQWEFTVTRKPLSPNQYCTSPSPPPVLAARFPNEHRGCSFSEQQCYPCCSNRCRQVCDHRHVEDCRTAVLKCIMYIRELCAL